jgi:hypothetical protein
MGQKPVVKDEIFLYPTESRPAEGLIQPLIQRILEELPQV